MRVTCRRRGEVVTPFRRQLSFSCGQPSAPQRQSSEHRMANRSNKPRTRSRRKAAAQEAPRVEEPANAVAVADESPVPSTGADSKATGAERPGADADRPSPGANRPPTGAKRTATGATRTATGATPSAPLDVARAESMAMELADLAEAEGGLEPDEQVEGEERIRSVQELLALGAGEVELLLFRIGQESFAFDLSAAEEAVELESVHAVPDMPDAMLGVFDLRGRLIPVYSPAALLCPPDSPTSGVLLLMRTRDRRVGVVVDDVEDVVVLGHGMLRPPPSVDGDGLVLGVAFFGDTLVTILDAHALVASCAAPATAEVA